MVASLVLGLALAQAEPVRDFKFPVMSVREFGDWLGKETGRLVIVGPEVGDRNVYINIKKRSLPELVKLVEQGVNFQVLDRNGALTFLPGKEVPAEQDFDHFEKNLERIVASSYSDEAMKKAMADLKELSKQIKPDGDYDPKLYQQLNKLGKFDPAFAVLHECLKTLGVRGITSLPMDDRVVFSTKTTRLQRAWPTDANRQKRWLNEAAIRKNQILGAGGGFSDEELTKLYFYSELMEEWGGVENPVSDFHLVVTRGMGSVSAELRCFNAEGRMVRTVSEYISTGEDDSRFEEVDYRDFENLYADMKGEFVLSESDSLELERMQKLYTFWGDAGDVSRADLEYFATLDQVNPMKGVYSRILDYGCEVTGNEAVMEVAAPILWYGGADTKKLKANEIARIFVSDELKEQRNTLIIKPERNRSVYGDYYVPTRSLAMVARTVLRDGVLTLDGLADAVKVLPNRKQVNQLVQSAVAISGQSSDMGTGDGLGTAGLEIYAMLSSAQRRLVTSETGFVMRWGQMPAGVQALLELLIRQNELEVTIGRNDVNSTAGAQPVEEMDEEMDEHWEGHPQMGLEQTVFLAGQEGFPGEIRLKMDRQSGVVVKQSTSEYSYRQFMSPEALAYQEYYLEEAKRRGEMVGGRDEWTYEYAAGNQQSLGLNLQFGKFWCGEYRFSFLDRSVKFSGLEGLPQSVRDDIAKRKAEIRKMMEEGGGGIPPAKLKVSY